MPDSRGKRRNVATHGREIDVDHIDPAAGIGAQQNGVVTRRQLLAAGLSPRAVEHRLVTRRLHRLHRGVYLVGHPVPPALAVETAALLACGVGAVLSHRTAAAVWGFAEPPSGLVDVTVVGRTLRSRPGLAVHRTEDLERRDTRIRDRLAVTAPERTLVDLAAVVSAAELALALNEARSRRLVRAPRLHSLLARSPRRRGTRTLRSLLAEGDLGFTRSEAERRLSDLIETGGPTAAPQERAGRGPRGRHVLAGAGRRCRGRRLRVSLGREAFELDRRRDADLIAAGCRVVRFTWRRIVSAPEAVLVGLARVL